MPRMINVNDLIAGDKIQGRTIYSMIIVDGRWVVTFEDDSQEVYNFDDMVNAKLWEDGRDG